MIADLLNQHPKILAECAIAERLRRNPAVTLHPTLYNTPLIYGPEAAKEAMIALYQEYIDVAEQHGLPLLLTAPTWRLDPIRVKEAGVPETINQDAVAFLTELRGNPSTLTSTPTSTPILVGALVGPQNDCYRPELAPSAEAAEAFHRIQITQLAASGADFILAQTLPSVAEALGIARAAAATKTDYIISFCCGTDGRVLDGSSLPDAMARIDQDLQRTRPLIGYFVNCSHPKFLLAAYEPRDLDRLIGIQANASSKDVTKLDGATKTESDPISQWAADMHRLHLEHSVPILGGCCGTSVQHMQFLAGETSKPPA